MSDPSTPAPGPTLDAALAAAARGWLVVPLHSIDDHGRCTCGEPDCRSAGKHPVGHLVPNGLSDATTDEQVIRGWWAEAPWANVGLATGRYGNGALVVDLDLDEDGAPAGPDTGTSSSASAAPPPTQ
jgi:hypothetical protein